MKFLYVKCWVVSIFQRIERFTMKKTTSRLSMVAFSLSWVVAACGDTNPSDTYPGNASTIAAAAEPRSGIAPLEVHFSNSVVGGDGPVTYEWDFGDGSTVSIESDPVHIFTNPGVYLVALTVTDVDGHCAADIIEVDVGLDAQPSIIAAAMPTGGVAPLDVSFLAETGGGNPVLSFLWDFGHDGSTSVIQNPVHTFQAAGLYEVTVTVVDVDGDAAFANLIVDVAEDHVPAGVNASVIPEAGDAPLQVVFECVMEGGNPPVTYHWEFGDGGISNFSDPIHTYTAPGVFTATCTAVDTDGDVAQGTVAVTVVSHNDPPEALASVVSGACGFPNETIVQLDASQSIDSDSDALSFQWTFVRVPIGSEVEFNNSSVVNPVFVPDSNGVYEIRVFVSDGVHRRGSEILIVEASNQAGEITIISGNEQAGTAGELMEETLDVAVSNTCGEPLPLTMVRWSGHNAIPAEYETWTDGGGYDFNFAWFGTRAGAGTITVASGAASTDYTFESGPSEPAFLVMEIAETTFADGDVDVNLQLTDAYLNPLTAPEITFDLGLERTGGSGVGPDAKFVWTDTTDLHQLVTVSGQFSTPAYYEVDDPEPVLVWINPEPLGDGTIITGVGQVLVFADDMEGADGWTRENPSQWEVGVPTFGPEAAHSGENVMGTVLGDTFDITFDDYTHRVADALPSGLALSSATLEYWQWYDFGGDDRPCSPGAGFVSMNGGEFIEPEGYPGPATCGDENLWGFGGCNAGWEKAEFDIPEFSGNSFDLGFHLVAPDYPNDITGPGWYIDDITIIGLADAGIIR